MTCQPYLLDRYFVAASGVNAARFPKIFFGNSYALIIKAVAAAFHPCKREPISDNHANEMSMGVPEAVTSKLRELVDLWGRLDPEVAQLSAPQKRKPPSDDEGDSDQDKDKDDRKIGGDAKSSAKQAAYGLRRRSYKKPTGAGGRHIASMENPTATWQWGPNKSSADLMSTFQSWKRGWEEYEASQPARDAQTKKTQKP